MANKTTSDDPSMKTGDFRLELTLHGKEFPVREDEGAFSNFFLNKMSKNLKEKNPESDYRLEKNNKAEITAVVWQKITEAQKKELEDGLEWSLRKVEESRAAGI